LFFGRFSSDGKVEKRDARRLAGPQTNFDVIDSVA